MGTETVRDSEPEDLAMAGIVKTLDGLLKIVRLYDTGECECFSDLQKSLAGLTGTLVAKPDALSDSGSAVNNEPENSR